MTYRVDTLDSLFDSTEGDDDAAHDAVRLEAALNEAEKAGWSLVNVVPQYRSLDDEGQAAGISDTLFVLHRSEKVTGPRGVLNG